jgi:hypothetical protein
LEGAWDGELPLERGRLKALGDLREKNDLHTALLRQLLQRGAKGLALDRQIVL